MEASAKNKTRHVKNTNQKNSSLAESPKAQIRSVLTFGWPGAAGSRGLAGMGQGQRRTAEHGRAKGGLKWDRTRGTSCAVACHAESERQAGASWTVGEMQKA